MVPVQSPIQRCNAVLRALGARYRLGEHRRSPWITVYQLGEGGKTREHSIPGYAAADPQAGESLQALLIGATRSGEPPVLPDGQEDLSVGAAHNPCWQEVEQHSRSFNGFPPGLLATHGVYRPVLSHA